jgi:hypothetical protein
MPGLDSTRLLFAGEDSMGFIIIKRQLVLHLHLLMNLVHWLKNGFFLNQPKLNPEEHEPSPNSLKDKPLSGKFLKIKKLLVVRFPEAHERPLLVEE